MFIGNCYQPFVLCHVEASEDQGKLATSICEVVETQWISKHTGISFKQMNMQPLFTCVRSCLIFNLILKLFSCRGWTSHHYYRSKEVSIWTPRTICTGKTKLQKTW